MCWWHALVHIHLCTCISHSNFIINKGNMEKKILNIFNNFHMFSCFKVWSLINKTEEVLGNNDLWNMALKVSEIIPAAQLLLLCKRARSHNSQEVLNFFYCNCALWLCHRSYPLIVYRDCTNIDLAAIKYGVRNLFKSLAATLIYYSLWIIYSLPHMFKHTFIYKC